MKTPIKSAGQIAPMTMTRKRETQMRYGSIHPAWKEIDALRTAHAAERQAHAATEAVARELRMALQIIDVGGLSLEQCRLHARAAVAHAEAAGVLANDPEVKHAERAKAMDAERLIGQLTATISNPKIADYIPFGLLDACLEWIKTTRSVGLVDTLANDPEVK